MAKRKQPEVSGDELDSASVDERECPQIEEHPASKASAVEKDLSTTSDTEKQPNCEDTSNPILIGTVEPVAEMDWGGKTIWTLLEKAGYTVW